MVVSVTLDRPRRRMMNTGCMQCPYRAEDSSAGYSVHNVVQVEDVGQFRQTHMATLSMHR